MTDRALVRRQLLIRKLLEVLSETDQPMAPKDVIATVAGRISLTPNERSLNNSGIPRFESFLRWTSTHATAIGWMTKRGGWAITDAGIEAMREYPGDELLAEQRRRYRDYYRAKKRPRKAYDDTRLAKVAAAVSLVDASWWTSFGDLAEVTDLTPQAVQVFLTSEPIANVHRVLRSDGRVAEGFRWADPERSDDPRAILADEGLAFDADGRADPAQRLTVEELAERLAEVEDSGAAESPARRAWLVRGSSVNGHDLVPVWLQKGSASLAAESLRPSTMPISTDELRTIVEEDYEHRSYSARATRHAEFDAFCNKMRVDDYVLTTSQGKAYVGRVTGDASYTKSRDDRSNLRRPVDWMNSTQPVPFSRLPHPLPARLHSQADVVDLTDNIGAIESLLAELGYSDVETKPEIARELVFHEVTVELADRLFVGADWLRDVVAVLRERRQLILFGPPGTGKTYLARELASHLTEPNAVKLVQFHPSYTYEDFFEGFRPVERTSGQVAFELRPGPFRRLVESAKENATQPHILIIDEINRANLAKVFGELYFLLEYRDDPIALLYSPESDFIMPPNVFVIGTMNTTDRSIALVDAAMRRRFGFIELHPDKPPTSGLLRAWLKQHQDEHPEAVHNLDAPDLLDALNERIEERDLAVGPSYLMRSSVYSSERGLDRAWETSIMPLLEELHYGASPESLAGYRLPPLRRALDARRQTTGETELS